MAKSCIFCGNTADSKEHLWPNWILKRLGTQAIRHTLGKVSKVLPRSEIVVRCVCTKCNGGWMSALESENIPLIGSLMQDIATPLDSDQQTSLSVWALKTAMVLDSVNAKERGRFYSEEECRALREHRKIPEQAYVWIGAYAREGYSADGTILSLDFPGKPKAAKASVSTFVVGHLAIQVLTIHPEPEHKNVRVDNIQMLPGEWDQLLERVWPIGTKPVSWPPSLTFTNSGKYSIGTLFARWKMGKNATK